MLAVLAAAAPSATAREDVGLDLDGHACEHFRAQPEEARVESSGFDEQSGRDTRVFPRDRVVDYDHMRLEVFIPDMNRPRASCVQTLRFSPIAVELSTLRLDARGLAIGSVDAPGRGVTHRHDGSVLEVMFDPPVPAGETVELVTAYEVSDPRRGLIWTPESPAWPGRAAQLHTQGQAETNSFWFPCHDFPNERLTTEIIATVPAGFLASSNGRLVAQRKGLRRVGSPNGATMLSAYETFHWLQDKPHANYLVSLVVGKFEVVDVGDMDAASGQGLSMPVYAPVGRAGDVQRTYSNTRAMLREFERVLDEPYPWDRYAQLVVWNFEAGGMENTSATTMYDTAIFSAAADVDHDLDGLIAHELAHQWFGDLLTCNSWEHIWLNEGFATYLEAIWFEARDGRPGYERDIIENFDRVLKDDMGQSPQAFGFWTNAYKSPWENFRRKANPYPKGASLLHMLRVRLGDEAFFRGLRAYIDEHKLGSVETNQFRRVMEEASGLSLEHMIHQWARRPGVPALSVSFQYVPNRNRLRFEVEQTQAIDAENPAFEFELPIFIKGTDGPDVVATPWVRSRSETFEVELEGPPSFVAINHDLGVLARITTRQSPELWLSQLGLGPTMAARVQAARALAQSTDDAGNEPLRRIALDRREPAFLRVECVRALASRNGANDVRSLATTATDDWEVRQAVSEALATLAARAENAGDRSFQEFSRRTLRARVQSDGSVKVRNASLKGLASLRDERAEELLREALGVSSQHDSTRQTALTALGENQFEGALRWVLPYTRPGFDGRTRAPAIAAVAKLAAQDPELAFATLRDIALTDREHRARMNAAQALVDLRDPRGLDVLAQMEQGVGPATSVGDAIAEMRGKLRARLGEPR